MHLLKFEQNVSERKTYMLFSTDTLYTSTFEHSLFSGTWTIAEVVV